MLELCGVDRLRSLEEQAPFAYFHPDGARYALAELPIMRALRRGEKFEGGVLGKRTLAAHGSGLTETVAPTG